ncbi:MAG: polysaccharide export protein [Hyphomicrobiales bacterium]|nr:polysaccharide export protein [Hyphomicrobiales bacterium]
MNRRQFLSGLVLIVPSACAPYYVATGFPPEAPDAPYTLASGDKVRVIVFGQDNLSNIYPVDGSGRISMPLIGTVPARGLTTRALERQISARLRNGFVREPQVTVDIDTYRPFFILGEVVASGQYPYVSGMTVEKAVAIAGGFSPRAYQYAGDVTRQINGEPFTASLPITAPVAPGDTIVIRERFL